MKTGNQIRKLTIDRNGVMATFDTFSNGNGLGMVDDGALIGGWERRNSV